MASYYSTVRCSTLVNYFANDPVPATNTSLPTSPDPFPAEVSAADYPLKSTDRPNRADLAPAASPGLRKGPRRPGVKAIKLFTAVIFELAA